MHAMVSIQKDISLLPYNTFGIDVNASNFCRVSSKEALISLINQAIFPISDWLIIGGGSNLLFCKNIEGLVLKNEIIGIEVIKENETHVWLKSYSGTIWHELVMYCVENNLGGIENLALIPGTVGAAPMQNIGAYGVEIKDTFVEATAIELSTGDTYIFGKDACNFGYRESIFKKEAKGKYFIYDVTFKLSKSPQLNMAYGDIQKIIKEKNIATPSIKDVADAVIQIRESKLPNPKDIGNAGSFFKNPEISIEQFSLLQQQFPNMPHYSLSNGKEKIPAAWLIEQAGWKGKQIGNTGNHAKQALVIVNYGHATGAEIWQHALLVRDDVQQKFGIILEAEVNIIA